MRSLKFIILLFLVASCVPEHKKEMAHVEEAPVLTQSVEHALSRADFERGDWPQQEWWEVFGDPQLNSLMLTALVESPTLKMAEARVKEAQEMAKRERARLFPHLKMKYLEQWEYFSKNGFVESFYPEIPGITLPATANQIDLTLNFDYEFDFFGKNRKRYQAALGRARAQLAEQAQATLTLLTTIAQTYFQLQAHLAEYDLLVDKLAARTELYDLSADRSTAGIDSILPVLTNEQPVYQVEQALLGVEQEIQIALHQLNVLVGKGPDEQSLVLPLSAAFSKPFPLPEDVTADLMARRPDLQTQIWLVEAAAKEIGAAKADFYPNVSLSAFGGLESLRFSDLFQIGSKMGGLVPAVTLPIFTGGRLTAQLKGKVAAFNEAVYSYNALILQAAEEIANQLVILQTKRDESDVQEKRVAAREAEYGLYQARYQKGVGNFLKVLDAEERLLDERFYQIQFNKERLLATVQLIKALGGGYRTSYEAKSHGE